jgi:hypothetical protein
MNEPTANQDTDLFGQPIPAADQGHNQDHGLTLNDDEYQAMEDAVEARLQEVQSNKGKTV